MRKSGQSSKSPEEKPENGTTKNFEERLTPALAEARHSSELKEGRDYEVENGNYVFTASYLRERGYCCGNGCRNCPY